MTELEQYAASIEELAKRLGLDYYNVDFEVAPASLMTEIAVYGLPVRMPHWSFGVRYIHQLVRQSMGHSKIFEVMFPGDPCRAFLMDGNSLAENTLVTAHVLGHADFSKNNQLFARFHEMAGGNIVARRCRRTPSSICSGSSPTTPPSSSSGSATSSSWCAPSRCTSTRCSPARS